MLKNASGGRLAIAYLLIASSTFILDAGFRTAEAADKCAVRAPDWASQTERLVWRAICAGEVADLSRLRDRVLTPRFIKTVLLDKAYQGAIGQRGVYIRKARFIEALDLADAVIEHPLRLENSVFQRPPSFKEFRSSHLVSLRHSSFTGCVGDDAVSFQSARIGGKLDLAGSTFDCKLDMGRVRVDGSLYLQTDGRHRAQYIRRGRWRRVSARGERHMGCHPATNERRRDA